MVALSWLGVLVIAISYALGRASQTQGALPLLWLGQILLFAPIVLRLLRPSCDAREALLGALALSMACYLVKVCYSPVMFRFPDELQHLRTISDLMSTGGLGVPNPALEISPSYPGLELVIAAFVQVLHLPLFPVATVVLGVLHLLASLAIYEIVHSLATVPRFAGLAVTIYATQPHFQHFDSMFIYQTVGLPLTLLSLWCLISASQRAHKPARRIRIGLAAVFAAASVPTHHISSYALFVMLLGALTIQLVRRQPRTAAATATVAGVLAATLAAWIGFVGTTTAMYFEPAVQQLADSLLAFNRPDGEPPAPPPQAGSIVDRYLAYVSVALISAAIIGGLWSALKRRRVEAWADVLLVGSLAYFGVVGIRLLASDGAELYGRAVSFVFIPVAFAITEFVARIPPARRTRLNLAGLAAIILWLGGLTSGWPPAWARLPHGYLPGAYESSIDQQGIDASRWTSQWLPTHRYLWASDQFNSTLLGTYGQQRTRRGVAELFASRRWTAADAAYVTANSIDFVLADVRLTQGLPAAGAYFADDPNAFRYTQPMSVGQLRKFDRAPAVSRLFDDGAIAVYDVRGVPSAGS